MNEHLYKNAFKNETRDLVDETRKGNLPPVFHRDDEIDKILKLLDRHQSVLITGPSGAGKTSIVYGIASEMMKRNRGKIRELSTTIPLVGTRYIGEWQTKLARITESAVNSKTVLFFTDVWNLSNAGKSANDPSCFLDSMRPQIENNRLCIIGEATPETLRRMNQVPGFVSLFHPVSIHPLSFETADDVVRQVAEKKKIGLSGEARSSLMDLTSRFLPAECQPGPALKLMDQVMDYQAQKRDIGEDEPLTTAFIEKVLTIYTGLPKFVVSKKTVMPAKDIRNWFCDRIVGQMAAIESVVETIALYKAGLNDPDRPIGTFLFVGPTGVGKTELARALAAFLFGSSGRLLRFDLSEFKDYHSFESLVGDAQNPDRPAGLIDPVKANPFQVVLFDEIEKAHSNIWDLFLQLLDDGTLTPPRGNPVNFRNTIIIATSNEGASEPSDVPGFTHGRNEGEKEKTIKTRLEKAFRPEFLNRFQHIVFFHSLTLEHVRKIALLELKRVLNRRGIRDRNLIVDVDDKAMDFLTKRGFDPRYGARALKREIQHSLVMPLAVKLMERDFNPGTALRMTCVKDRIRIKIIETPESRAFEKENEPIRTSTGRKRTRKDLEKTILDVRNKIERTAEGMNETGLIARRKELLETRMSGHFWQNRDQAILVLRDLDFHTSWLDRLERLRDHVDRLEEKLKESSLRRDIEKLSVHLERLEEKADTVYLEMGHIGPDGVWDAILEIRPMGENGLKARDSITRCIMDWAVYRGMAVEWLREPLDDHEPVMLAVKGNYALGYLAHENGLHYVEEGKKSGKISSVAKVKLAAWQEHVETPVYTHHRALKSTGRFGGKIRSRLECEGGVVLQNARTLSENRDLACQLVSSWRRALVESDQIVRRIVLTPDFKVRDYLGDVFTGKKDILSPRGFHDLLCRRIRHYQKNSVVSRK